MKRTNTRTDISSNALQPAIRRLLTMREVIAYITYSRPSIYRLLANGDFPQPIKLGANRVAFYADEIDRWIASRQRVSLITDANQPPYATHSNDVQS